MTFKTIICSLALATILCIRICHGGSLPVELERMTIRNRSDKELAPGVSYHFRDYVNPFQDGPVAVHFLVIDWNKTEPGFSLAIAKCGQKRRKPSEMATERNALATVNGAYHTTDDPSQPYFTLKIDGIVHEGTAPGGDTSLAFHPGQRPIIGKYTPKLLATYENVISGDGLIGFHAKPPPPTKEERQKERNPCTAVGQVPNGATVILVADGRSKESIGLSYTEECAMLVPFGCTQIVGLDSGGSSVMAHRTGNGMSVVNKPNRKIILGVTISFGERKVHDALMLLDSRSAHVLDPIQKPEPLRISICTNHRKRDKWISGTPSTPTWTGYRSRPTTNN